MPWYSADTDEKTAALQREPLRQATPARKLEMVGQMWRAVMTLAMAGLKSRYPDETPAALRRRLADQILGAELAEKAYGKRTPEE